jgi:uncharacterized protein
MNHEHYSPDYIRSVLQDVKTVALVGASANTVRPSYFVMKYLIEKGYTVFPVNPGLAGQELLGQQVYATLADIPVSIDMVDIFRNSEAALDVTKEALELPQKPKVIWMQLSVWNVEAAELAETEGLRVVMNRCPKMEFGKLSGEWGWVGGNSGVISSKRQSMNANGRLQSLSLGPREK